MAAQERIPVRRRHQLGPFERNWGENCFEAVALHKPHPVHASHEQTSPYWGQSQTRVEPHDFQPWDNWLYAWQNPYPERSIVAILFEPICGAVIVSAVTAGDITSTPLRWNSRRKAVLSLPDGNQFRPHAGWRWLIKPRATRPGSGYLRTAQAGLPPTIIGNRATTTSCHYAPHSR